MNLLGALGGVGKGVMVGAEELRRQDEADRRKELARQQQEAYAQQKASDEAYSEARKAIGTRKLDTAAPNYAATNDAALELAQQAPYGANGVEFDPNNEAHASYAKFLTGASQAIPQTKAVSAADAERNFAASPQATARDARAATDRAYALDAASAAEIDRKTKADITAVQTGTMKLIRLREIGLLSDDEAIKQLQELSRVIPNGYELVDGVDENGTRTLTYGGNGVTQFSVPRTKKSIDDMLQGVLDNSSVEMMSAALKRKHEADVLAETTRHNQAVEAVQAKNADTNEAYRRDMAGAAALRAGGVRGAGNAKELAAEVKTNAQLYSYTPLNGEKPIEHIAAKSLYSNMIKNPKIGPEQAYSVMAQIKDEAEKQSVDPKTGAVDPIKFLPIFDGMVKRADDAMRKSQQTAKPSAAAKPPSATSAPATSQVPAAAERKAIPAPGGVRPPSAQQVAMNAPPPNIGGVSTAERDRRIALMNTLSGTSTKRHQEGIARRDADVAANFDSMLANIRRGMTRAEALKTLAWFEDNNGSLSNQQRKQLRDARRAAGL